MNYFPLFADLTGRPVLVVGGGSVAARKVGLLLKANAQVRIVARQLNEELSELERQNKVLWIAKEFNAEQMRTVMLVIAATNDEVLNHRIFHLAESQHKLVNVVDDQPHCSFIFPSIIDRNPIQIAISSGGKAPVLARLLREKLEALLPQHLGKIAEISGKWRDQVKAKLASVTERRRFWEKMFSGRFASLVKNQQEAKAEEELAEQLENNYQGGFVSLVGAGPGDAGLLEILSLIRRDAERIFVGKRANGCSVAQEETNQLLLTLAQQGKRVVRLKGGDPFVFGRGGEELEVLAQHQIPFSVVPGITAGIGATAYAGIPLTHRDYAQSAIFVTGHRKADASDIEWQTLARSHQTLVIYMGTLKAQVIAEHLQQYGRAANTPVAIISQGTQLTQKTAIGTLANLAELAEKAETPALIVVGEVVTLHEQLAWFGEEKQRQKQPHFTLESLTISQVA
ncbi:MAG: uroporphyrinogen-III C-methyltransferase [Haemophilus parainfluenzae]|nr:uroporphyrinogen-III C-methyltransferase [Haemophilus parainfluenzae]